jgi:hypothetical protein
MIRKSGHRFSEKIMRQQKKLGAFLSAAITFRKPGIATFATRSRRGRAPLTPARVQGR